MDAFKAMRLHERTKKVHSQSDLGPESYKKVRMMRWNEQRSLRNDQSVRRTTIRVRGLKCK